MPVFVFLFYLAAGLVASLAVVRIGAEGRRFFLFNAALALAMGAIALILRVVGPGRWGWGAALEPSAYGVGLSATALAVLAAYVLLGALRSAPRPLLRLSAVLLAAAVVTDARTLHAAGGPLPYGTALHTVNAVTSAWLAGSILLAMVLGHFYLVLPRLSIAPLRSLFRFSLAGLAARIVLVAGAGLLWWTGGDAAEALTVKVFLDRGVFVLQRVLFGLLIPAIFAWFTYKTIEMRSTQSATGILYVVVFSTLVGEALSVYLSLETAIPI